MSVPPGDLRRPWIFRPVPVQTFGLPCRRSRRTFAGPLRPVRYMQPLPPESVILAAVPAGSLKYGPFWPFSGPYRHDRPGVNKSPQIAPGSNTGFSGPRKGLLKNFSILTPRAVFGRKKHFTIKSNFFALENVPSMHPGGRFLPILCKIQNATFYKMQIIICMVKFYIVTSPRVL